MTMLIGNLSLAAAMLAGLATLVVALLAARLAARAPASIGTATSRRSAVSLSLRLLPSAARAGIFVAAFLLTVSAAALMAAMLGSDFSLAYVARYAERALPAGYKAAAFWAGQEGSLLLWGWVLAVMGVVFVFQQRRDSRKAANAPGCSDRPEGLVAVGVLAAVTAFFAALMLFAANPFAAAEVVPADGRGLNPMLQNIGMIAHPPILFLGYAGCTVPFALLVGALVAGRRESGAAHWVARARPWVLASWIFLGAGILLGAQWAYVELGWGGYWAWDPVENASLLPWLTATALLHSAMAQRHRGMLKRWNAALAAVTFILCIFGTYLTRSGIVDSVHTFGQSLVGTFFGVFLAVVTLLAVGLIAFRWGALKSERPLRHLVSREAAFLGANIVLVGMTAVTLYGTLMPVLSRWFTGKRMSVNQPFYNGRVLPLAVGVLGLMALAPMLSYGGDAARKRVRGLAVPAALAVAAVGVLWASHIRSAWAVAVAAAATILAGNILLDIVRSVRARRHNTGEGLAAAAVGLLRGNHRRYGAHVAHVGVVLLAAGIAGSSLYNTTQLVQLAPGQAAEVGRYTVRLNGMDEVRGPNYVAVAARVQVLDETGAAVESLEPQRRFYDKAEQASSEVAIRTDWRQDLYVNLAGWEAGGRLATLQVIINPLVSWIWVGGIVLILGAAFCLLPRLPSWGGVAEGADALKTADAAPAESPAQPAHVPQAPRVEAEATEVTTGQPAGGTVRVKRHRKSRGRRRRGEAPVGTGH